MRIEQLIENLPIEPVAGRVDVSLAGLADDSRRVRRGGLFVARRGHDRDGHDYIEQAVSAGASAVLVERAGLVPAGLTGLQTPDVSAVLGELAERFYGRPSRRLTLIGITGTNGKTTTAYMVRHLLNQAGRRCGMLTTVEIDDGETVRPAVLTTPGAIALSEHLAAMVDHGCDACVMECSSHALDQRRCDGLAFDAAVFTNLSGDHLDYHATMTAYAQAKKRLFALVGGSGRAVVNGDDAWGGQMAAAAGCPVARYGITDESATYRAKVMNAGAQGSEMALVTPGGRWTVTLPLVGIHNVYNLLASVAAVEGCGVEAGQWTGAVGTMPKVPGRLERVDLAGVSLPFTVVVDYAHTDDALRNVLGALRPLTAGRLIVVFGCGGDRDRSKRPRMAQVACDGADVMIITSDNPRTEQASAIIGDIVAGVSADRRSNVMVEADRRRAIRRAIGLAEAGDVVLLAGKGHETYQIIGTERLDFDDRAEANKALRERFVES